MVDMNRREFLKRAAGAVVAIPVMAVLQKPPDARPAIDLEDPEMWYDYDVDTATDYASMERRYTSPVGHCEACSWT